MPFSSMDDTSVVTALINAATGQKQTDQPVLASPARCPPRLSALIQQCLTVNKELRPSFATIAQRTMPNVSDYTRSRHAHSQLMTSW
jgi:hypothetical protein